MQATWERVSINKTKATLLLFAVLSIAFIAIIASSIVKIDGDEVGIVEKKLFGGSLPEGKVLAINGENGVQAQTLAPGWHVKWKWQYNIIQIRMTEIKSGFVGLIQAADGRSLPTGAIFAPEWNEPEKMLNAEYFLGQGKGYKGPQLSVLSPGRYRVNTKLFTITTVPITNVKVGTVVGKLFSEIGPRYLDRAGGYTRIIKLPKCRLGDGGKLVLLQLVEQAKDKTDAQA